LRDFGVHLVKASESRSYPALVTFAGIPANGKFHIGHTVETGRGPRIPKRPVEAL
jgi:hypothetical protein